MLTQKVVPIFDVEKIPLDSFITFAIHTKEDVYEVDEENDIFIEYYNGIITGVTEEEISFITNKYCPIKGIHISAVTGPEPKVVVKGIRSTLYYVGDEII